VFFERLYSESVKRTNVASLVDNFDSIQKSERKSSKGSIRSMKLFSLDKELRLKRDSDRFRESSES
jgi:hypothetical protein